MSTDDTLRALREHARRLREQADRIDEIARPTVPMSTDWLGPSCPPDSRPPAEGDRFHDAMLVLAGALAGAAATQIVPHLLRLLGWLS